MSEVMDPTNDAPAVDQDGAEATQAAETETENVPFESLPPTWQNEIRKLRDEAAKYRQRAKTAAESVKPELESQLREEFVTREGELLQRIEELNTRYEEALFKASESERNMIKLRLAASHGIPKDKVDDFVKRLQGETEDELAEDAKTLAELFVPTVAEDRSQGLGTATALNDSAILRSLRAVANKGH